MPPPRSPVTLVVIERSPTFVCTVVVSKKVAPLATSRNRLRRRVREVLRNLARTTKQPFRCVVSVRSPDLPKGKELETLLVALVRISDILNR